MGNILRPHQDFLQNNAWLSQSQNSLRYQTSQLGSVVPMIIGTVRQPVNIVNLANYQGPGGGKRARAWGRCRWAARIPSPARAAPAARGPARKAPPAKNRRIIRSTSITCCASARSTAWAWFSPTPRSPVSAHCRSISTAASTATRPTRPSPGSAFRRLFRRLPCRRDAVGPRHVAGLAEFVDRGHQRAGRHRGADFPMDANPGSAITYFQPTRATAPAGRRRCSTICSPAPAPPMAIMPGRAIGDLGVVGRPAESGRLARRHRQIDQQRNRLVGQTLKDHPLGD